MLLLSGKQPQEIILGNSIAIAKKLLSLRISPLKIRATMNFLKIYLRFQNQDLMANFVHELLLINQNHETMGIEELILAEIRKEGKLEGKLEGKREGRTEAEQEMKFAFVKSLLFNSDFDDDKIALLAGVPADFVQNVRNDAGNS